MTQIQWLVEANRNKIAALKLLLLNLEVRIEKLNRESLQSKLIYFPVEQRN